MIRTSVFRSTEALVGMIAEGTSPIASRSGIDPMGVDTERPGAGQLTERPLATISTSASAQRLTSGAHQGAAGLSRPNDL
jgi:hypothetical protein